MKLNQWTLGLAAVGVVSLASAVNAEEQMSPLQTALSSTTISGWVDTSLEWTLDRSGIQGSIPFRAGKQDGFNLNVVGLRLEKALDESEWAAGYTAELIFGPDAVNYNTSVNAGYNDNDFAIKQAYVALRTPIGTGIDWKVGVFDAIVGYESFNSANNPNFSRSWGYAIEPAEHTGILGTYRISDTVAVSAGVANTSISMLNDRNNNDGETWHKTAMGSVAVTAPEDCGFLSGSTLYAGAVVGVNNLGSYFGSGTADQANYYAGATLNTPVTGLKAGLAFDYVESLGGVDGDDAWIAGVYASFQASEKLSLHGRGEYGESGDVGADGGSILSLTGTVQYDLWQNVVSRLEVRWDQGYLFEPSSFADTGVGFYANMVYKF